MKLGIHRPRIDVPSVVTAWAFALCLGAPLRAQNGECASPYAAMSKLYDKPFHLYMIDSAQTDARLHAGQPTISESIWTTTAIYVLARGKWLKSPADVSEMRKARQDTPTKKATCSHLRDESVNGEAATVWRIHSVSEAGTNDTDLWISRASGLPVKSDAHQDVGGVMGKSHIVTRYEYTNVRPPGDVR